MKYFILIFALIATTMAASRKPTQSLSSSQGQDIPIVSKSINLEPNGAYSYSYETGNGISASENGVGGQYAKGSADWTTSDGTHVFFQYTADENGYQASGSHVPQIPEAIVRAIEWIKAHPSPEYQK